MNTVKYLFSVLPVLIMTVIGGGCCAAHHSLSFSIGWFLYVSRFSNSILLPGKAVFTSTQKHTQPSTHTN